MTMMHHRFALTAGIETRDLTRLEEMVVAIEACAAPPLHLWERLGTAAYEAIGVGLPSPDAGGRLLSLCEDAGLPKPQVFCKFITGGCDSLIIPWTIMSHQTLLPAIDRLGLKRADVGDLETLQDRPVAATRAARTQFVVNPEMCGWTVRP